MSRRKTKRNPSLEYERRKQRRTKAVSHIGIASPAVGQIIGAYVPMPPVWRATGFGTVAIAREQPDGLSCYGFAVIDLQRGGLYIPGGKDDLQANVVIPELEDFLRMNEIPASQPGDPEVAGRLLFGAYAYSLECDCSWPDDVFKTLSLFPKPPGTVGDWLRWFKSSDGMVSDRLWPIIEHQLELTDEIPADKDLMVFTTVVFSVPDTDRLQALLDNAEPEFALDGEESETRRYSATRAYPKGHWNPLSQLPGARQNVGSLMVNNGTVKVEAKTLAFAARIITRIIQLYGPGIEMRESEYFDPNQKADRLRRTRDSSG